MDDTARSIIEKITVRYETPRKIPSGDLCKVFYDCARLSPADLARLAANAHGELAEDAFDVAVGIAYNGILYASALAGGRSITILTTDGALLGPSVVGRNVVVVDDVVHSGRRIGAAVDRIVAAGGKVIAGACIIDRSGGSTTHINIPLWSAYQTAME